MSTTIDGFEDSYSATLFGTFEALSEQFTMTEHPVYAKWNVPVWLDFEDAEQRLTVGVLLTRHGRPVQWIAPSTEEQAHSIRQRMLSVWAGRADTGFARYQPERVPA